MGRKRFFTVKSFSVVQASGVPRKKDRLCRPGATLFEERIVLFHASSEADALAQARRESQAHVDATEDDDDNSFRYAVAGDALNRYGQRLTVSALDAFDVHELDGGVELEGVLYTSSELQREPQSLDQLRARVLEGSQSQALGRLRMPWAGWVPVAPGDSFGVANLAEAAFAESLLPGLGSEGEASGRGAARGRKRHFGVKTLYRTVTRGGPRDVDAYFAPEAQMVEERVVLFASSSGEKALKEAEREARDHAAEQSCDEEGEPARNLYGQRLETEWLGFAEVYELRDLPTAGQAVYAFAELQLEAEPTAGFVARRLARPFARGEDVTSLTQFTEAGIAREVLPEVAPQAARRLRG